MIDAAVLAAIARALEQDGDVDLARAALRRADPLLRGPALRRLRGAHADALLATGAPQDPEGLRHALRFAYLLIARVEPPKARGDLAAVAAAYEAERASRPVRAGPRWPTPLAALALVAAVSAAALGLAREASTAAPPSHAAVAEPPAPPVRGAFATGGVPVPVPGDALIAGALGADLPSYLIALDGRADAPGAAERAKLDAEMSDARARALSPAVREALGPGASQALDALFSAARAAAEPGAGPAGGDALAQAVATLDDELAATGAGYFADGDVITGTDTGRRHVLVYTFRVAWVSLFAAGAATVRALHLRRLDKLNWSHTLLGFTRPTLRAAAVLLDQLDEQVLTLVAPALAPGAPVPLFEPEASADARAKVEARAGELVRAEYGALPGLDAGAAVKLGKLLVRRRALFARWEKLASARGLTLVVPPRLRLPEGFAASLADLVPHDELAELREIDAALDDRTRADAFAAVRDALATSVERHEVQHRLDALGPQPPPMPKALEARVGPLEHAGEERRHAATARAELSAYLAELARDPRTPRVGLTFIARFLFDQRFHGAPESYAALAILEGLAAGLGVGVKAPLLAGGAIDRGAVADVYLALAALPPDRLREAAKKLWEALFEAPLPDLHKLGDAPP
jgi:hypothetical protein